MANTNDNKTAPRKPSDLVPPTIAPERPAEAKPGMELLCERFENGGAVIAQVLGGDDRWVRVRIAEMARDWLILRERIDLAKGTWDHVAADYPAPAEDAEFDRQYRPSKDAPDTRLLDRARAAAAVLMDLLPPDLRPDVERILRRIEGKALPVPGGSVYARWMGRGVFAGAYISGDSREQKRDAPHGTEGFFPVGSVAKWNARHPGVFVEL